jgi:hypothetical protein
METNPNPRTYNIFSIICGVWFLLTGAFWTYFMNLIVAYPIGLLGIFLWYKARKVDASNRWNKVALIIHIAGLIISFAALAILLIYN